MRTHNPERNTRKVSGSLLGNRYEVWEDVAISGEKAAENMEPTEEETVK